ncbi:MAG: lipoprotein, partial [Candidatus Krumholzibacteriota bacterium]|nr:lipoprotein [Candidatus Krumholzibacteriota bacterium]
DARRFILPAAGQGRSYTAWSLAHLADIGNEMTLIFPGIVVLGGLAIVLAVRELRSRRGEGDVFSILAGKEFLSSSFFPQLVFALFLWIPSSLFLLFFKPELGMARDWDLFAITAIGPFALVFAVLGRAQASEVARRLTGIVLPPVLVMSAVLTAAWIGINADPARSVSRFESILTVDRTRAEYAYESLAAFHQRRKDVAGEIRAWEKAVEFSPNPRYLYTLGLRYYSVGEKEKAVLALERCLRMRPAHDRARRSLAQMLYFMKRDDELIAVCNEGRRVSPEEGLYPFLLGKTYLGMGRFQEALDAFDACRELNPPAQVAAEIDNLLRSVPPQDLEEHRTKKEQGKTR